MIKSQTNQLKWAKNLDKYFSKWDTQITNKYIKDVQNY